MRMQIQPGLVWAWRAPGRLQIGLDPAVGAVLDGLTAGDERVLDSLDGGGSDVGRVLRVARTAGVPPARARELLDALRCAGVLVLRHTPAARLRTLTLETREVLRPTARTFALTYAGGDGWDVVAARRARSVAVLGLGTTGLAVALGLARSGVGLVVPLDDHRVTAADVRPGGFGHADVGRRRSAAAADLLTTAMPQVRTATRDGDARPDLVVVVRSGLHDPSRLDPLVREDVRHLGVLLRERDAVVGPLVRPGRSACLRCLDLHRRDRDPEWPRVVPQVADRHGEGEEPVLSALASALAVAQALTELDRRVDPACLGATLEIALPDGTVGVRDWPPHAECGCTGLPVRAAPLPRAVGGVLQTQ